PCREVGSGLGAVHPAPESVRRQSPAGFTPRSNSSLAEDPVRRERAMGERRDGSSEGIDRRSFLKYSAAAGAAASAASTLGITGAPHAEAATSRRDSFRWNEATIAELQAAMHSGKTTSLRLTRAYMKRIERMDFSGPTVNSVIELNPDAEAI